MEHGTVKFFDSRDNKRYGFISVEGGEEIFFHFNDGQPFMAIADRDEPIFGGKFGQKLQEIFSIPARDPRPGDKIFFIRCRGRKGYKACPWGFAEDYERAHPNLVSLE